LQVLDDFAPPNLLPGNYLVFHAIGPGMPVQSAGQEATPTIVDWKQTNPLMRFVDMGDVHVASAAVARSTDWGDTVVDGDRGPLVVYGERYGRRCVWVGFTTSASDFPIKVAFPIFLTNAVQFLTDASGTANTIRPGGPISLPGGSGRWSVTGPQMRTPGQTDCGNNPGVTCDYTNTMQAGVYRFQGKASAFAYAANVASERSSDITERDHPGLGGGPALPGAGRTIAAKLDIWTWVAAAALVALALEWIAYHRRRPVS
jgi:hypothetical protein